MIQGQTYYFSNDGKTWTPKIFIGYSTVYPGEIAETSYKYSKYSEYEQTKKESCFVCKEEKAIICERCHSEECIKACGHN